jgi:hypothetical protein
VDTLIRPQTPWWRWTEDSIYGRYDFNLYAYAVEAYETAEKAQETVLDTAGCFPRDHIGNRLINDTREGGYTYTGSVTGKKGIIDTEEDAEGFYDYPEVAALPDTDQDGMPDEWESANGCNPEVADNNVRHASGYTMLEMYLHYAMTHKAPMDDGYESGSEGVENITGEDVGTQKYIHDGQLLIRRGDKIYTPQGQTIQ